MKEFELEPGEEIIVHARKHWFIFLSELLPYALLAILPFALSKLLPLAQPLTRFVALVDLTSPFGRACIGMWLLLVWTAAWGTFTKYFLNAWVLTNQRLVDIKQRTFFSRKVSSLFLSRVQDVTTNVVGLLPSLLDLGEIKVQTAAEEVEFVMRGIPTPEAMRDLILKYVPVEEKPGV